MKHTSLIVLAFIITGMLWWWIADTGPTPDATDTESIARTAAVEHSSPKASETAGVQHDTRATTADTQALPPGSTTPTPPPLGVPAGMIPKDYPPYLGVVASKWFPPRMGNGCKTPSALLAEMAEEPRDTLWAPRIERELRMLLEPHPLSFAVSIGCRATICQVTAIGPHADALEHQAEVKRFWGIFQRRLAAAAVGPEFATYRYFSGMEPMGELKAIDGIVLTSVGQASPDEPASCASFVPAVEPGPGTQ